VSGRRVLIVDDESQIRRALRVGLTGHGYEVQVAASGEEALDLAAVAPPDLVILDLVLPGVSGLEVCKTLREWSAVPIVVLSVRGEERQKVEALDLGADDYLAKPFGMDELLARVRAVLGRAPHGSPSPVFKSGALRLDQGRRLVTLGGCEVHLTPTEYDILRYFMANAGKVITHRTLLEAVWGPDGGGASERLRVYVAQLRRKIEPDLGHPFYIRTEPRIGYRFCPEPEPGES
jgi:two-component system, OmpR family, KDP operon response regulator KdpE